MDLTREERGEGGGGLKRFFDNFFRSRSISAGMSKPFLA